MINIGLKQQDIDIVKLVISEFPEVKQALIFGSRAKSNFKNGSDVDIALKGNDLNLNIITRISFKLNEDTSLPYMFDVLNYNTITSDELTEHIDRVGVTIYEKQEPLSKIINKI